MICLKCKKGIIKGYYHLTTPADITYNCSDCDFYKHTDETTDITIPKDELELKLRNDKSIKVENKNW